MYGAKITAFTGADIPPPEAVIAPASIVLTMHQLLAGALAVGPIKWDAIKGYIDGILTTGTRDDKTYWGYSQTIGRSDGKVNVMRTALGWGKAQMDEVFVAGSGLDL